MFSNYYDERQFPTTNFNVLDIIFSCYNALNTKIYGYHFVVPYSQSNMSEETFL